MRVIETVYQGDDRDTQRIFLSDLNKLTRQHKIRCPEFARICECFFPKAEDASSLDEVPFIPVGLFKTLLLSSVSDDSKFQIFRSSGTTGTPSQVVLDRTTAAGQTEWLTWTMKSWLGDKRRRMLIVDSPATLKGTSAKSARAAAVLGMMKFGKDFHWLLNSEGETDPEALSEWMGVNHEEPIFIFGFTFMVWKHLIRELSDQSLDLSRAVLFHGGGWKSLLAEAVSPRQFREALLELFRISNVHDYYGMVEQLGSIWVEASEGVLVPTSRSSALIRDPKTLEPLEPGQPGLIQIFSSLPESYPGHSILTEDLGRFVPNLVRPEIYGRYGLQVLGRLPKAQPRGCSDAISPRRDLADD